MALKIVIKDCPKFCWSDGCRQRLSWKSLRLWKICILCEKLKPRRFKLLFSMTTSHKVPTPALCAPTLWKPKKLQLPNHVRFTSLFEKPLASLGQSALLLGTHGAVSYPDLRSAAEQNKDQKMTFWLSVFPSYLFSKLLQASSQRVKHQNIQETSKLSLTPFRPPSSSKF